MELAAGFKEGLQNHSTPDDYSTLVVSSLLRSKILFMFSKAMSPVPSGSDPLTQEDPETFCTETLMFHVDECVLQSSLSDTCLSARPPECKPLLGQTPPAKPSGLLEPKVQ